MVFGSSSRLPVRLHHVQSTIGARHACVARGVQVACTIGRIRRCLRVAAWDRAELILGTLAGHEDIVLPCKHLPLRTILLQWPRVM